MFPKDPTKYLVVLGTTSLATMVLLVISLKVLTQIVGLTRRQKRLQVGQADPVLILFIVSITLATVFLLCYLSLEFMRYSNMHEGSPLWGFLGSAFIQ